MYALEIADRTFLETLQRRTFRYFAEEANPTTGLILDSTRTGAPASIAAIGMALACYPVAVERGFLDPKAAIRRTLATLRFLWDAPQGEDPDATGYRGLFYHFLDMDTGARANTSELSTIDTAILIAGALTAGEYFGGKDPDGAEIHTLADALYRRVDWAWITHRDHGISLGWKPESGFLPYHWGGYNEALLLQILALGSPTHPVRPATYARWLETYKWREIYGHAHVYCGPLFTHQLSHIWLDFRGIHDSYMRTRGIDYFENSRRATLVHRENARRNPRGFEGYGEDVWGVTASDGPGPACHQVGGRERRFWPYRARGVPWGPDDGTLSPWAVAASLPFAPSPTLRGLRTIDARYPEMSSEYGFKCSFNPTFPGGGWVASGYFGLDQGPVVLMIENLFTELVWTLFKQVPHVIHGLRQAGFTGGWLEAC